MIKGKVLVCIDVELLPPGNKANMSLDVELDLLVKICFFTADLLKDTIGYIKGEELMKKLNYSRLFFQFYGPARHVMNKMTELHVKDPKQPGKGVQILTIEMLDKEFKAIQQQKMQQQQQQRMPIFMQEPYMQDKEFLESLKKIVLRGWKAPLSSSGNQEDDDKVSDDQNGAESNDNDELDFSDLS